MQRLCNVHVGWQLTWCTAFVNSDPASLNTYASEIR
jgi:hypothetical protein